MKMLNRSLGGLAGILLSALSLNCASQNRNAIARPILVEYSHADGFSISMAKPAISFTYDKDRDTCITSEKGGMSYYDQFCDKTIEEVVDPLLGLKTPTTAEKDVYKAKVESYKAMLHVPSFIVVWKK